MVQLFVPGLEVLRQRRSEKWSGLGPATIGATVAEMDFELAPPVASVLHEAVARSDLGYAHEVTARLREAFTGFAERRLGWRVDPDRLALVPEVMVGLVELCRVLAPGGRIGFATAAYPPFLEQLPAAGFEIRRLPLRADASFDLDRLAAELRDGLRVLILANPHNPTGRVLPRAELEQIAELCAQYDAWVLADEIHAPLVLPGARHVPWLEVSPAARERGIALTSASKAFNLAGLKTALVVTASDRAQDVVRRMPYGAEQVGLLGVIAAETAFAEGDPWLDALIDQLDRNRTLIGEKLPAGITWSPPQATYLAWLDCGGLGLGPDPATVFRDQALVALSPGQDYDPAARDHVRLNFGTGTELLTEILRRMESVLPG
ncbi:aminotransferase class I and II [Kribbella flavida DSM 17836]|uniref:cysteine-S-conjugate beta-lyase n=1 Tax=Kribbella flavida (strain DSM 17836 / JCM 10339 / NBRC 14399) TaxID=479435 RepID=D2PPN4_KRIFD|nr:aminotransferase class I/II-fold pyridoxal phosphate-dependent enzyme [Kribbella flavida]ADB30996.1 aminotransferase class I and II [Kribbella flavida DSM 17836]